MLEVFRSRKMAFLMIVGFSSGLPLYLTQRTLQAWMTTAGVDLTTIGFLSLIGLPYSLKFVWSPFIDRFSLPFLGRRKGWLMVSQCALAIAIALMALARPANTLQFIACTAFVIAFLSATQDIIADAYRSDIVEPAEAGAGMAMFVMGYRIALILTGSAMLIVAQLTSWPMAYVSAAVVMLGVMFMSLGAAEPVLNERPPQSLSEAVRMPFKEFTERNGVLKAIAILAFIILYRLGEFMINNMTTSFLLQTGFTLSDVGTIQSGVGLFAIMAGVMMGGWVVSRIGINRSLWIFGAVEAVSNLAYWILSNVGKNYKVMVGTIIIENWSVGLGTAALVAFLMSLCNPRFSATQYALLSSVMAVGRDVLVSPSGSLAKLIGWPSFFLASVVAVLPALMLLPLFAPWKTKETRA